MQVFFTDLNFIDKCKEITIKYKDGTELTFKGEKHEKLYINASEILCFTLNN